MAYTYLIGWREHDKWYYGMRHANKVPPQQDLWHVYKTSSKYVKEFAKENGDPDVIRVHREFSDEHDAHLFESKFLRRVDAVYNDRWLNQNIGGVPMGGQPAHMNYIVGSTQSEEHKMLRGIFNKKSEAHKKKISESLSGENNPMFGRTKEKHPSYGKKRTPEQLEKIRQGQLKRYERLRREGICLKRGPMSDETKRKISEAKRRK